MLPIDKDTALNSEFQTYILVLAGLLKHEHAGSVSFRFPRDSNWQWGVSSAQVRMAYC